MRPKGAAMKIISSVTDLTSNIETLKRYAESTNASEGSFYRQLLRDGICFVVDESGFFAPSRFIGYKNNKATSHQRSDMKDGRVTNVAINELLGDEPKNDVALEAEYKRICASLDIGVRER